MVRKVTRLLGVLLNLTATLFAATLFLAPPAIAEFPYTPEAATSGSVCTTRDSHFEEFRYPEQIPYCVRRVSSSLKKQIYDAYGVPSKCRKYYTIDHFYPLSLGGTNRTDNLWPEAKSIKNLRKNLETDLFQRLQRGTITQAQALTMIHESKMNPPIQDPDALDICL